MIVECATGKTTAERVKYCNMLLRELKNIKKNYTQLTENVEFLVDKLTKAAQTITEQNEWLDCIYLALKDDTTGIMRTALKEKEAIKNYKNKIKKEKYKNGSL